MIQILDMVHEEFARIRAALVCGEVQIARFCLRTVEALVVEATKRVTDLWYTLAGYEALVEYHGGLRRGGSSRVLLEEASMVENLSGKVSETKSKLKQKWEEALPVDLRCEYFVFFYGL